VQKIGLVTGTSVQTYTEPQIYDAIYDAFNMLFRKRFWEHLSDWHTFALDGVNGYLTSDLSSIVISYEDAKNFHVPDNGNIIVKPQGEEHLIVNGSHPLYYTAVKWNAADDAFTKKVFKFWPITATGSVRFYARS